MQALLLRRVAVAGGRAVVVFVALMPVTLLTLIVTGGGESVAALLIGVVSIVGVVTCAAVGRRALKPLVVLAIVAVAHFLVLASALTPQRVDSERELRAAEYGKPIAFVTVEHYWDPATYPQTYSWNPWEDPATADSGRYLVSLALVLAPLLVVARGFELVLGNRA